MSCFTDDYAVKKRKFPQSRNGIDRYKNNFMS